MNIYTIALHYPECKFTMPYYFTSYKEAVLYGEYKFRTQYDMIDYKITKCTKAYSFYKLK